VEVTAEGSANNNPDNIVTRFFIYSTLARADGMDQKGGRLINLYIKN